MTRATAALKATTAIVTATSVTSIVETATNTSKASSIAMEYNICQKSICFDGRIGINFLKK